MVPSPLPARGGWGDFGPFGTSLENERERVGSHCCSAITDQGLKDVVTEGDGSF
jgi:hypothetical protein